MTVKFSNNRVTLSVKMSKKFNVSKDDTMENIINEFSLTKDKAQEYIEKYW